MKTIQVLINTYNRPKKFLSLIGQILSYNHLYDIEILIVEDKSMADYSEAKTLLDSMCPFNYTWVKTKEHCGKENYWQIINLAYSLLSDKEFDYLIHLPDDIKLVNNFLDKAIATYDAIQDKRKACLNLLREISRNNPGWTNQKEKPGANVSNTGWVDMCYICKKNFLKTLNYEVLPIDPVWSADPERSSGVGMQISRRLIKASRTIYQVKKSLVEHGAHKSVMHPQHRITNPLISNHMKTVATMATMPSRVKSLKEAVFSLINQVDELHIYLNDFEKVPEFLLNDFKIKIFMSQREAGDMGDAGKFFLSEKKEGYHFLVDDDIIYPKDYVKMMISHIEHHQRKYVIGLHGRIFGNLPVESYYHGHTASFRVLDTVQKDSFVHVTGTGCCAYHTDTIRIPMSAFKATNMTDIWFSKFCNDNQVPLLVVAHAGGWLRESQKYDQQQSIYNFCHNNDKLQTRITNETEWQPFPVL